jgi:hypothetical protein
MGINKLLLAENKYSATVGGATPNIPLIGLPMASAQVVRIFTG